MDENAEITQLLRHLMGCGRQPSADADPHVEVKRLLDVLDELMPSIIEVGGYFRRQLEDVARRFQFIKEVRGFGLMIGVEFVKDRETKVPAKQLTDRIVDLAYERGLLTLSCGQSVIRIAPPLSISKSEVDEGLRMFEEALTQAEKETL